MNTLRSNLSRPEVSDELLESDPHLREQADRVGFESFRHYAPLPECVPIRYADTAQAREFLAEARKSRQPMMAPMQPSQPLGDRAFVDLTVAPEAPPTAGRPPTITAPDSMRRRMRAEFNSLESFDDLLYLASLGGLDQKTRKEALLVAADVLSAQQAPTVRACMMQKMLPLYRPVNPQFIEGLLDQSKDLLKELDSLGRDVSDETQQVQINLISAFLRSALLTEWARDDFPAAMDFVRGLPELERHYGFLSIARVLSRPIH